MHPLVVHCKKSKFDIYCGRPSQWGNPYVVGKDGPRGTLIDKYEVYLREQLRIGAIPISDLLALKGKTLSCWCAPLPCHCEVIVKLIEEYTAAIEDDAA